MHAISYIVGGCAIKVPKQKIDSGLERSRRSKKTPSNHENPSSSNNMSAMKTSSSEKSLSIQSKNNRTTWSKVFKSLKQMIAYQFYEHPVDPRSCRITPRVMLYGCTTKDEHYEQIENTLTNSRGKYGLAGLLAAGFKFQFVPCEEHTNHSGKLCPRQASRPHCTCDTRLMHVDTNTVVTKSNLKKFIADGEMYEEIVRLCQEHAQDLMREEGSLHWVSVCEDVQKGTPIRILVDREYPIHGVECIGLENDSVHDNIHLRRKQEDDGNDDNIENEVETMLITTGKGKVRAGIFSRQHLLVSGIESSTALPMVRDAKQRNMRVAILDPNARGDRYGMSTYEQSMRVLFGTENAHEKRTMSKIGTGPIYILAHSASGSQLTRYLQTQGQHILSRIKSIAFTDSNHSIQWLKNHSEMSTLFQSPSTVYIRSSNIYRDDNWENHQCGDEVIADEYWKHRFGATCTIWAGTTDHSLTNFTSQEQIWAHFDKCRECCHIDTQENN